MMNKLFKNITFLLFAIFSTFGLYAQEECLLNEKAPKKFVVDKANIFSAREIASLEQKLHRYSDSSSNEILVVTVNNLCGTSKSDFTIQLAEKWGVGKSKKDNGIVLMIKPHGAKGDRHVFIAVGYGLEPVITDAGTSKIINTELIPSFKSGNFYGGVDQATNTLMSLASKEFNEKSYLSKKGSNKKTLYSILIVFAILFIISRFSNKGGSGGSGGSRGGSILPFMFLGGTSRSYGSGGSFGGGSGGFGGFGGGSFGGGGAGGSW